MKITPNPKCLACQGSGILYESEEFWGESCLRELYCDCVVEQIPEDFDGEIELSTAPLTTAERMLE